MQSYILSAANVLRLLVRGRRGGWDGIARGVGGRRAVGDVGGGRHHGCGSREIGADGARSRWRAATSCCGCRVGLVEDSDAVGPGLGLVHTEGCDVVQRSQWVDLGRLARDGGSSSLCPLGLLLPHLRALPEHHLLGLSFRCLSYKARVVLVALALRWQGSRIRVVVVVGRVGRCLWLLVVGSSPPQKVETAPPRP